MDPVFHPLPRARRTAPLNLFQDPKFDQLTQRACAALAPQGLPLGEILAVVQRIQDGDVHGWTRAWNQAATGAESQAIEQHARGQRGSARQSYLRASVFYALAARFAEPDYPVGEGKWKRARACFRQAAELRGGIEPFEIPSQTHPIAGYFVSAGAGRHPALVVVGGLDDSAEEMAMRFGDVAGARGWHLVAIEGPGQDASFFARGLGFVPDYELPLRAVVDELMSRPEVDATRIALAGFGWGGHFALRAGLHDERLGAVIADPPVTDLKEFVCAQVPESAIVRRLGARDLHSALVKLKEFDLDRMKGRDLKIRCPLLLLVSEADGEVVLNQARQAARVLGERATLHRFGEEALDSMQIDNLPALHAVLFDWLAEVGMPDGMPDQSRTMRAASAEASSSTRLTATPR